jgi:Ca2+-binding EF-hand superfamily protein
MIYTLFNNRTDEDEIIRLFKKFDANNDGEIVLQGLFNFNNTFLNQYI